MSRSLGLGRLGCMGFWGSECSEHGMSLASSFLELLVPDPQDPSASFNAKIIYSLKYWATLLRS